MQAQRILVSLKLCLLVALVAGLLLSGGRAAHAATITVNTTNDELNVDGDCSLREAIEAANTDAAVDACTAGSGADTIELPAGTYSFSIPGTDEDANQTGDLDITRSLTISGAGAPLTIIDANALDRVFHILRGDVTISGVTIQNGLVSSPGTGGGLLSSGRLILSDSTVRGNSITDGDLALGGGLATGGTAELTNVVFTDNTLSRVQTTGGGAIFNSGTLLLTEGTISNNTAWTGGGIVNFNSLTVVNSTLHGNSAASGGGAIVNLYAATLTNTTVSGNTAGFGGGFATWGRAVATISSSTFNANGASEGGGIYNYSATVTLTSTIISNSTSGGNCGGPDPSTSGGHNLSSDIFCPFAAAGDIVNTDPLLGPLADNGGPTLTHALLVGSPAIDGGSPDCPPPATDQRGVTRPFDGNNDGTAICDIGAYEVDVVVPTPTPTLTPSPTPAATPTVTAATTPTPCPPGKVPADGGCGTPIPTPTHTPTPTLDQAAGAMQVDCDASISGIQSACTHALGASFQVEIHITLAPAGGYNFFQVKLEWTEGVISYLPTANPADEALWVPCTIPARLSSAEIPSLAEPSVFFTCIPFPQLTTDDTTTGAVLTFEMQCKSTPDAPDPGQSILRLVPFVIGRAGTAFADINNEPRVPALTDATVTCVAPTPTPAPTSTPTPTLTPVPPALIGGIGSFSELPEAAGTPLEEEGSSGVNASGVAGIAVAVTAGAFALGGAAWYARRRLR